MKAVMDTFNQNQLTAAEALHMNQIAQQEELNNNFESLMAKEFGKVKDEVIQVGSNFIKSNIPESLKPYLNNLPNEALAVLAGEIGRASCREEVESGGG